jgi:hypothetical protein
MRSIKGIHNRFTRVRNYNRFTRVRNHNRFTRVRNYNRFTRVRDTTACLFEWLIPFTAALDESDKSSGEVPAQLALGAWDTAAWCFKHGSGHALLCGR